MRLMRTLIRLLRAAYVGLVAAEADWLSTGDESDSADLTETRMAA